MEKKIGENFAVSHGGKLGIQARRNLITGAALYGLAITNMPAHADARIGSWQTDIPRALSALRGIQAQWVNISDSVVGKERAGGMLVRNNLMITYENEPVELSIPAGESLGVVVKDCEVSSVTSPEYGWVEGDIIKGVNGQTVIDGLSLKRAVDAAKASAGPMKLRIARNAPTPFIDLERKLRDAYGSLEDADLPDLEDMQIGVGNVKATAASAAGGGSLTDLRREIDKLESQLAIVVKAIRK